MPRIPKGRVCRVRLTCWAKASLMAVSLFAFLLGSSFGQQQSAGYRAYSLRYVPANQVVPELRKFLAPDAEVLVDSRMNRVLIRSKDDEQVVVDLIQTLDQPAPGQTRGESKQPTVVQSYNVAHLDLERVANQLKAKYLHAPDVRVAPDTRTHKLIVVAPEPIQNEIARQLKAWSPKTAPLNPSTNPTQHTSPPVTRRSHLLENISWREFEDSVQRIWGRRITVSTHRNGELATLQLASLDGPIGTFQIDRRENVVSIEAPATTARALSKLVKAVDVVRKNASEVNEIVRLHRADPSKVEKAVDLLHSLAKKSDSETSDVLQIFRQSRGTERTGGRVVSMIFQANAPAEEEKAGNQQDENKAAADADSGDTLEAGGGLIGQVQIEFDERLDLMFIRGHPRDVARIKQIIDQIIQQSQLTQPDVEIYQLEHINNEAVADLVAQLYEQVYASRQGTVQITPLVKPNALLLVGRPESIQAVITLIKQLDTPVPPETQFEVFQLKYMSAVDAQNRIAGFFGGAQQQQIGAQQPTVATGGGGLAARVRVVADYRSNSLIVQASPRDMTEVARLIRKIDTNNIDAVNEVKIFKLKNSLAEELAPVLQDALNGQLEGAGQSDVGTGAGGQLGGGQQGARGQQQVAQVRSAMLSLMTVDTETGTLLKSGIMFDVRVTADINSNSLVVTGPAENMMLIKALVDQLDQLPSADATIKVFTVINGDATTLFNMLQQLFGQQTQGGVGQQGGLGQVPLQTGAAGGESSLVPLRFAVDVRTNSIIVSGAEGDLNVVAALLSRLDLDDLESRTTIVYRLRNAPAQDVALAINDLLDGRRSINQIDPTVISPFEQTDREVIVVPELVSNSLIINATPGYQEEIMKIIEDLDMRPPMIMIQVLIADVVLSDTEEFGVELGIQDSLLFDRGLGVIGFPFNQAGLGNNADALALGTAGSVAGQALSNLSVGRTNADLGYGGLVLSAGNESVNVLLRALHDRQRIQILSRPQIMTLDNLAAFIQVGQRVPRITAVQQNVNNTTNSVVLENVGILLGVTPRVSPDGLIVMEVDAERSALSPQPGIPIFTDAFGNVIRSPIIDIQTAQTTISARSGQTVVFAGLITKSSTSVRRGTPIISDLPLIGPAFRFDSEVSRRSELLIILTPFIIHGDDDLEWINQREAERMSWCLADVVDVHGETAPQGINYWQAPEPEVIYPDYDPTGTNFPQTGDTQTLPEPNFAQPLLPNQSTHRSESPSVSTGSTLPVVNTQVERVARSDPRHPVYPTVIFSKQPNHPTPDESRFTDNPNLGRLPDVQGSAR